MRTLTAIFLLVALGITAVPAQEPKVRMSIRDMITDHPERWASFVRGVEVMRERSEQNPNDPTGWSFQANIHGFIGSQDHSAWGQCQHRNWLFLPWHRAYLHFFERILRDASGDPELTLPYWNWDDEQRRSIPEPYFMAGALEANRVMDTPQETLPLADGFRRIGDANLAIVQPHFPGGSGVTIGTGGDTEGSFPQFRTLQAGITERFAHDGVHGIVGGDMADPRTAARDPIFWSHHANVDRIWEKWVAVRGRDRLPDDDAWLDSTFTLFDENGDEVQISVRDVLDTTELGYVYDTLPDADVPATPADDDVVDEALRADRPLEISAQASLGASDEALVLVEDRATVSVSLEAAVPGAEILESVGPDGSRDRVALVIEGIEFDTTPSGVFEVYFNFPEANYTTQPDTVNLVGVITPFGMRPRELGDTNNYAIDVTFPITRLQEEGVWNENTLDVTIVPRGPDADGEPQQLVLSDAIHFQEFRLERLTYSPQEVADSSLDAMVDRVASLFEAEQELPTIPVCSWQEL